MGNFLGNFDPLTLVLSTLLFISLWLVISEKRYGVKGKILELTLFVSLLYGYFAAVEIRGTSVNSLFLGAVFVIFLRLAYLDIRYGEMTMLDILGLWFSVLVLTVFYNQIFGCPCISENMVIFSIAVLILIILDDLFNRESIIGGADFDIFFIILGMALTFCKTIYDNINISWFIIGDFLGLFFEAIFINFIVYSIVYIVARKVLKKGKGGIRMLPAFILPFLLCAASILSKVNF